MERMNTEVGVTKGSHVMVTNQIQVSDKMAVFTIEVASLTNKLVQIVTGFQPKEENYVLCYKFCKSNFCYHRFLDVNSRNVARSIENMCFKFRVNSQSVKAEVLHHLTENFLELDLERNFAKSDAHYGMLLFLLCTSVSPTKASYSPPPSPLLLRLPTNTNNFDWAAYLMEGIEIPEFSDTDSELHFSIAADQAQRPRSGSEPASMHIHQMHHHHIHHLPPDIDTALITNTGEFSDLNIDAIIRQEQQYGDFPISGMASSILPHLAPPQPMPNDPTLTSAALDSPLQVHRQMNTAGW